MRARLLDMGEVSAVRSQSLARAVAAGIEPASEPVVILVKPSAPVVSVGGGAPVAASVDLELCRARRIPVVRSPRPDGARFHGPSQLLVRLVAPAERAVALGLAAESGPWPQRAAGPLLEVCVRLGLEARVGDGGRVDVAGATIARFEAAALPGSVAVSWDLFVGSDEGELETEARALAAGGVAAVESLAASRTAFGAELASPVGFAELAEALIGAIESGLGLELVPSMPTPAEMEAIYEWDERLVVAELLATPT